MSSNRVRMGVIGVGHLGRLHAMQLKLVPEAEFVGIYDTDGDRSREIGRELDVPVFASAAQLIDVSEALSIVTPTIAHFEHAKAALQAGKHVFIEKPVTETVDQADQLIALSESRGLNIQVGHIERFNPAIIALEPLKINPLFIEAHRMANFNPRGTDVAVVMDLMIHDIDLILSFVKSPVESIQASGISIISPTEDIANCRLQFENGCVANVTASRISMQKMRKMRFFQPDAYISVDFEKGISDVYHITAEGGAEPGLGTTFALGEIEKGLDKKSVRYARLEKADINPLRHELTLFCRSILNKTVPAVTGADGRRALMVADMILSRISEHTELVKQHWNF